VGLREAVTKLDKDKVIQHLVGRVQDKFDTLGGGRVNEDNAMSVALQDMIPMFNHGVGIEDVVGLVVDEMLLLTDKE
jgi:hypothetical protein